MSMSSEAARLHDGNLRRRNTVRLDSAHFESLAEAVADGVFPNGGEAFRDGLRSMFDRDVSPPPRTALDYSGDGEGGRLTVRLTIHRQRQVENEEENWPSRSDLLRAALRCALADAGCLDYDVDEEAG